jgi:prevent-host-death family protein
MSHMASVGIRELKQNASAVVARVTRGEVLTITDRGRPVAQIGPLPTNRVDQLLDAGLARPPRHSLDAMPAPVALPEVSLSEELARMRDEERS